MQLTLQFEMSHVLLGYIYEIYDKRTNECVYIGHTSGHPLKRWGEHIRLVFTPTSKRTPVHEYMTEQEPMHFDFRVREEVFYKTRLDLRKREQVWMDQLSPRCNVKAALGPGRTFVVCECGLSCEARNLMRHLRTPRHANRMRYGPKPDPPVVCECGQRLRYRTNLWRHRKSAKHARQLKSLRTYGGPATKLTVSAPRSRAPSGSEASDPAEAQTP